MQQLNIYLFVSVIRLIVGIWRGVGLPELIPGSTNRAPRYLKKKMSASVRTSSNPAYGGACAEAVKDTARMVKTARALNEDFMIKRETTDRQKRVTEEYFEQDEGNVIQSNNDTTFIEKFAFQNLPDVYFLYELKGIYRFNYGAETAFIRGKRLSSNNLSKRV